MHVTKKEINKKRRKIRGKEMAIKGKRIFSCVGFRKDTIFSSFISHVEYLCKGHEKKKKKKKKKKVKEKLNNELQRSKANQTN